MEYLNVTWLPTPTGDGLAVGFAGAGLGQPLPEHVKLRPDVFGPILLANAATAPGKADCSGLTLGKSGDDVSPVT